MTLLLMDDSKVAYCDKTFFNDRKARIIIDPGHGGAETGVTSPSGLNEKDVALNMAKMLKQFLDEKYTVKLTRIGDFNVNIYERTSLANKEKGDLFISLHAGSCAGDSSQGITLFLYSRQNVAMGENGDESVLESQNRWSHIQLPHTGDSQQAALLIQQAFNESQTDVAISLQNAPIAVLKGADMPSLVVEIGCLSTHSGEKELKDSGEITKYMSTLANGIDRFLIMKNKNP